MPVLHNYKCIFVHITKTGGTSILSALNLPYNDYTENRELLVGEISSLDLRDKKLSSPVLQHITALELKDLVGPDIFNSYYKFAFVRNPWDRVLSQYFFDRNLYHKDNPVSFHDFLINMNDFHKLDQVSFIGDDSGNILVDYIGKYESITRDFDVICKKIGLKRPSLPVLNSTRHYHYSNYYTDYLRDMVSEIYKRDIETFDYTFKQKKIFWWRRVKLLKVTPANGIV